MFLSKLFGKKHQDTAPVAAQPTQDQAQNTPTEPSAVAPVSAVEATPTASFESAPVEVATSVEATPVNTFTTEPVQNIDQAPVSEPQPEPFPSEPVIAPAPEQPQNPNDPPQQQV